MDSSRVVLALGLAVLLGGCGNGLTPTAPASHHALADLPTADAEPFRDGVVPLVFGGDPRDGLALTVGYETSVEQICATGELQTSRGLGVFVPTGSGRVAVITQTRDANAFVYQYGGGIVTQPCQQIAGAPLLGTGRVRYSAQATNISGLAGLGPGAFEINATVDGVIDLLAGGQARVRGRLRLRGAPDGTITVDDERVTLTPIPEFVHP